MDLENEPVFFLRGRDKEGTAFVNNGYLYVTSGCISGRFALGYNALDTARNAPDAGGQVVINGRHVDAHKIFVFRADDERYLVFEGKHKDDDEEHDCLPVLALLVPRDQYRYDVRIDCGQHPWFWCEMTINKTPAIYQPEEEEEEKKE